MAESARVRRRTVAVVTDSTAGLPDELVADRDLTVVPLTVTIDGVAGQEGVQVSPADVAKALVARRGPVPTTPPPPTEITSAFSPLAGEGAAGLGSWRLAA